MKCRPRSMAKMAMRLPGFAVLRNCNACLCAQPWLSVFVLSASNSRTLTAGGSGNGEKLVKTSVGILGICVDDGCGAGVFSSKKETLCGFFFLCVLKGFFFFSWVGVAVFSAVD